MEPWSDAKALLPTSMQAAGGGNFQSPIDGTPREHIERRAEALEATLQRVPREELHVDRDRRLLC